jgi:hypothetical protein
MSRPKHYSPEIKRFIVSALYHEAKARGVPMTVLTNELLTAGLQHTDGWQKAHEAMLLKDSSPPYHTARRLILPKFTDKLSAGQRPH